MPSPAKLTQGSTFKHVVIMSMTGAFGLMCMFIVDLVDMLFLSMLGEKEAVAAVGFSSAIMFFTISLSIAVSISATALVSKAVGEGDIELAKRRAVNVLAFGIVFSSVVVWLLWPKIPHILLFVGATGLTLDLATGYLQILILGMPAVMIGMIGSGIMRALGDARRAMYATLIGGLINAVLDPIFIFGFGLGVQGAAIASLIARFSMVAVSYYGVVYVHKMLAEFDLMDFFKDVKCISVIAVPAMLTNMSSPLANAIVMEHTSSFGDDAVAAVAIIGRVIPVVFAGVFALSGAVGPILGQNYGAGRFDRMHRAMSSAVIYAFGYCVVLCLVLYNMQDWLVAVFSATQESADLIHFFATFVSFSFFFQSLLFIAIAAFNNLGKPLNSTLLNFGRATLGTLPLITIFALFMGAEGILFGQAVGSVIFGCLGFYMARNYITELEEKEARNLTPSQYHNYDEML
ncbi:multidrug transporter MATE [Marinomonas ushuaiensis DSM 15871]|uniref:Multidrug transporter MATE n=1 Tax=Marinomonas ushuaiensis DSM 15871 TaxID=1122207 RepID=X7E519_9GAMM|nr:MATE family efflux transporter [Marinomonas ushuaiensis]ETX10940.1 multidrug transporter MATE [Marinomonas ushuaiensis DSM 15871]